MSQLNESYEFCAQICACAGSNFTSAFEILPFRERRAMEAVYAFMRTADDLVDSSLSTVDRTRSLDEFQNTFQQSLLQSDKCTFSNDWTRLFPAVLDTIREFNIPESYFFEVLHGIRMDLERKFYKNTEELESYCYHVASAVGLICLYIWGVPASELQSEPQTPTFRAAVACGKALQWTNILRDVLEDAQNDRLYIPLEDWSTIIPADSEESMFQVVKSRILAGKISGFRPILENGLRQTEEFYREARTLTSRIPRQNRRIFRLITGVYHGIFRKIRKDPVLIFRKRVRLNRLEKLRIYISVFFAEICEKVFPDACYFTKRE